MEELVNDFMKAYMEVQSLKGALLSAESELSRRAKVLCEEMAGAAKGDPVLIVTPLGMASLKFDEEWWEFRPYSDAVRVEYLQTLADIRHEKQVQLEALEVLQQNPDKQKATDS